MGFKEEALPTLKNLENQTKNIPKAYICMGGQSKAKKARCGNIRRLSIVPFQSIWQSHDFLIFSKNLKKSDKSRTN